jgi:hypothetical protein
MSHCCGNDRRHQAHRSGRLSGPVATLRRWFWLVAVLSIVAVAWVWFTFGPGKSSDLAAAPTTPTTTGRIEGPRIQFDETYFDFGQVPADEYVEHTFTYRNVGTQPLILQKEVLATAEEGC